MYINWKEEAKTEGLFIKEMRQYIEHLKEVGHVPPTLTKRLDWLDIYSYNVSYIGYYTHLYVRDKDGVLHHYQANMIDDSKNQNGIVKVNYMGTKCNKILNAKFKEINGVTTRKAFGYCQRPIIHKCVPKQFYYIDNSYSGKLLHNVSKADYTSHYPANIYGRLPTWHGHKVLDGTVKPTEEYPFAFYINSGHIAELDTFDTHDWLDHPLNFCLFGENFDYTPPEHDITILCKASSYTFDDTYQYFFDRRKSNAYISDGITAKNVLNSTIGYMHLKDVDNKKNRLDHIAAVVIARSNQKMLGAIDNVGLHNVLMAVVDSIIYKGNWEIGTEEKCLGELHQEIVGADFIMRGTNQYMFFRDGELIEKKHGGFNKNLYFDKPEDILLWEKGNVTTNKEF
jgi:hypothetical protein